MSYKTVYDYVQNLDVPINRNVIAAKVCEVTKQSVKQIRSGLDPEACRGLFISVKNADHPIVKQLGENNIIVTSRGLNRCWERFVFTKELMHLFDDSNELCDTGEKFELLLDQLSISDQEMSPAALAEIKAFWKALAALCPEKKRLEYAEQRKNNEIDDFTIATQLRIPEQYVRRLFEKRYERIISSLVGQ